MQARKIKQTLGHYGGRTWGMKAQEYQLHSLLVTILLLLQTASYYSTQIQLLLLNASVTSSSVPSSRVLGRATLPLLPLLLYLLQGEWLQLLAHSQGHQLQNIFSYLSSRQSVNRKPETKTLLQSAYYKTIT